MVSKQDNIRFDLKFWVIVGLLAAFGLYILFDKDPEPNKEKITALENAIAIGDQRIKDRDIKIQSLLKRISEDSVLSLEKEATFKTQANSLKARLANQRTKVDTIVRDNPTLKLFVEQQDSLIQLHEVRIDTLTADLKELQINTQQLTANFQEQIKDLQDNYQSQKEISDTYRKEIRKVRRGNRWLKVAGVSLGVAGLFLGSQL